MKAGIHIMSILLLFTAAGFGQFEGIVYVYPSQEDSVLSITLPAAWDVQLEEDVLHATPQDESIYLSLWAVGEATDLTTALDALEETISDFLPEFTRGEIDTAEINDIDFITVNGRGLDKEGDAFNAAVALFSPVEETIYILLYFGVPKAEEEHREELVGILNSIESY